MDHLGVWTQKGRKRLRHTRVRTRILAEPIGTSSFYLQTQTWPLKVQTFLYLPVAIRPNSLAIAYVVNFLPSTRRARFEPKEIHVFLVDKRQWDRFCSANYEFPCKCCLHIQETKIDSAEFNKCCNINRSFIKPNQLQIVIKEAFTKLQHFQQN